MAKSDKIVMEINNEDIQQSDIWNINSILSSIFAYSDRKDLVNFKIVCKKWKNLTNPIIYKTINLARSLDIRNQVYGESLYREAISNAEAVECISNNAKNAPFVKDLNFRSILEPRIAINFFETFRFICNLSIGSIYMSQDQFLGIVSPLTQLQDLTISNIRINRVIGERVYKEFVQLPSSLKKLRDDGITLIDNPELLVQTINSHSNLIEFSTNSDINDNCLEPFSKPYPSLLSFEYNDFKLWINQSLLTTLENNPQLVSLKLSLKSWSRKIFNYINSNLINLEELKLRDRGNNAMDFITIFSQPTKIKKLDIEWTGLSNFSLNSILINCPNLEELGLNRIGSVPEDNFVKILNFINPQKLKKLDINCDFLDEGVFESILLNCSHLNELSIILFFEWKNNLKAICENCANLERLNISLPGNTFYDILNSFSGEFYETKFFTKNHKCKSTLTHLTFNYFKVTDSKPSYFNSFENLKSIKYVTQPYDNYHRSDIKTKFNKDLWPSYRLFIKDNMYNYDIEFKKILN
jgi:hypothetical protein